MRNLILFLFSLICVIKINAQDVSIVPYPKSVQITDGKPFVLNKKYTIKSSQSLINAAKLFINDAKTLYSVNGTLSSKNADINIVEDKSLKAEEYQLSVGKSGVSIKASNDKSAIMGLTSLLQMIDMSNRSIKLCEIKDSPAYGYRCYMLDVARQWVEFESMKQIVDLCRWYKVKYMQLHLSDDQLYTFESKKYPNLTKKGRFYTQKQLRSLVKYAEERGVIIIPEFDLPGHSSAMRKAMPELFGENAWSVIDLVNPKTVSAVKEIAKEMMDVFYTSPYFHIGADEAWFGAYEKLDHVKDYVKKMNYDNVHDAYLNFIVEMNNFVKSCGKQTIVWESFPGRGSRKVTIPNDMYVIAWETMYQSPMSLINNGYKVINASWKPAYTTPGRRWTAQYIYEWNMHRWENHWNAAPSYHPMSISKNIDLLGGQMCAWEMIDYEEVITAHQRIAAFSENLWNDENKQPYSQYKLRADNVDQKIMTLLFPATETRSGFKDGDVYNLNDNRVNYFGNAASVFFKSENKSNFITYTTDGTMPTPKSQKLVKPIELTSKTVVKYGMFDNHGNIVGYKSLQYVFEPFDIIHLGKICDQRDRIYGRKEIFSGILTVMLKNNVPNSSLYYTIDGSNPTSKSTLYTKPFDISNSTKIRVACVKDGKIVGEQYNCDYELDNYEKNITTGKKVIVGKDLNGKVDENTKYMVDGRVDLNDHWGSNHEKTVIVDLGSPVKVTASRLYTYWDNNRYYQYTIEASNDGTNWKEMVNRSANTEKATQEGYIDLLPNNTTARYFRINILKNSANPAVHIVEFRLY